jgi:predicted DNA-binding transcriptional regulator AlpA
MTFRGDMKRIRKPISAALLSRPGVARPVRASQRGDDLRERRWVTGPTLRAMLSISAVTLWRWRHDQSTKFPAAKRINGRLYFPWNEVATWLDKQQDAVAGSTAACIGGAR